MKEVEMLKNYFGKEPDVILAFLFGSFAGGRAQDESDLDVAVFLREGGSESKIWFDITRLIKKEVDLVSLNDAPATLISNIFKTGLPLAIKDRNLYWDLYLVKTREAEDFAEFLQDYWRIYELARSLMPEEKARLLLRLQFLESELEEVDVFGGLSFAEYEADKIKRRNIERWAENIVNAAIDIAKIVLASEKRPMPKTYEETLFAFARLAGLSEAEAEIFSVMARIRNILAHEYFNVLYGRIREFIKTAPPLHKKVLEFLRKYASD